VGDDITLLLLGSEVAGVVGEAASRGLEIAVGAVVSEMVTGGTTIVVVVGVVGLRGGGDGLAARLIRVGEGGSALLGLGGNTTPLDVVGTAIKWGVTGTEDGVGGAGGLDGETRLDDIEGLNNLPSAANSRCRSSLLVGGAVGGGSSWKTEGRCGDASEVVVPCRVGGNADCR